MVSDEIQRDYAPTGKLRVALNHGNRVLVGRASDGAPAGISVDLARALAEVLRLEPVFVEYDRAGDVSASAQAYQWDVCFLAVDPKRAEVIAFTEPYVRIEGSYLVPAGSPAQTSEDVISRKLRVGTVEGSAYTLHLARQPGADCLVCKPSFQLALAAFDAGEIDAMAGIRQAMEGEAGLRPGARVLDPPFMEIRQAMGMPAGRPRAAAHLRSFVADMARSGGVGDILERHGVARECAILPGAS